METVLTGRVPAPRSGEDAAAALLALADAEADAVADALHDGALQALVVARYAADAAVRGADPALARDAVQEALVALRRAVWLVRPRGDEGLSEALAGLSGHRAAAGDPPLALAVDEDAAAALSTACAAVAYRFVQRAAAASTGPLAVRVGRTPDGVHVEVAVEVADPAGELLRARAVGGAVTALPGGSTLLLLPPSHPPVEEAP